jgi:hypothetical protein
MEGGRKPKVERDRAPSPYLSCKRLTRQGLVGGGSDKSSPCLRSCSFPSSCNAFSSRPCCSRRARSRACLVLGLISSFRGSPISATRRRARSRSIVACRSDFPGSCRELTAHDFFCKAEIQRVSSQLQPAYAARAKFVWLAVDSLLAEEDCGIDRQGALRWNPRSD